MAGKFSLEAAIKVVDRYSRPLGKLEAKAKRVARGLRGSFDRVNRAVDRGLAGLKRFGQAAAAAGIVAGVALADVVSTGAEFEQTLINAAAKFPGEVNKGTAAFLELEETAKRIGSETEFSSKAAAEGLNFLAMAGFDARQSVAALPGVVDLATAAQVELGEASDVATDSLGAFNLMTKDATQLGKNLARVNDVIAKTTTSANTDVQQLFEAMKAGGPVATSAGASLETFAAMAGELANAGIKGSAAGNTLKNVFARLAAPPTEAAKALKKLRIETKDANGNLRDVTDIIGELNSKTKNLGTGTKAGILTDIFGLRAVAGANVLLNSGSERLKEYRRSLENAAGASQKMAATMRDSTANDFKSFQSAVEGVKIAIFDVVKGPLREVVQSITAWTRANKDLIASKVQEFVTWFKDNLPEIIKWGKRIAIVVGAFLALAAVVKTVAAAVAVLVPVGKLLLGLLGGFMLPITLFVGALVYFWPQVKAFFTGLWGLAKTIGGAIADFFTSTWSSVVEFFGPIFSRIGEIARGVFEFVVGIAVLYFRYLKAIWTPIIQVFVMLWEGIKAHYSAIWEGIATAAGLYFAALKAVWMPVIELFLAIWGRVKAAFVAAWDVVAGHAKVIFEKVKRIWAPIGEFFSKLWDGIAKTFESVVGAVLGRIEKAIDFVRDIGSEALGGSPASAPPPRVEPGVAGPGERTARTITESTTTEKSEVTIKTPPGVAAAVTRKPRGRSRLRMQPSGAM